PTTTTTSETTTAANLDARRRSAPRGAASGPRGARSSIGSVTSAPPAPFVRTRRGGGTTGVVPPPLVPAGGGTRRPDRMARRSAGSRERQRGGVGAGRGVRRQAEIEVRADRAVARGVAGRGRCQRRRHRQAVTGRDARRHRQA